MIGADLLLHAKRVVHAWNTEHRRWTMLLERIEHLLRNEACGIDRSATDGKWHQGEDGHAEGVKLRQTFLIT